MKGRYLFGLPFLGVNVNTKEIEFLVDTGFNGELLLPSNIINELNLKRVGFAQYMTADGDTIDADVFTAEITWFRDKKKVSVIASHADFSLLGMGLLRNVKTILDPLKDLLVIESSE